MSANQPEQVRNPFYLRASPIRVSDATMTTPTASSLLGLPSADGSEMTESRPSSASSHSFAVKAEDPDTVPPSAHSTAIPANWMDELVVNLSQPALQPFRQPVPQPESQQALQEAPQQEPSTFSRMRSYMNLMSRQPRPETIQKVSAYKTAPMFSSRVSTALQEANEDAFKQFGLVGVGSPAAHSDISNQHYLEHNLIFANMDEPWSAFICGSQGAGKSHTLSCLLENTLIQDDAVGQLPNPLAAMVFHYDTYSSASCTQVCEAAYLCSSGIPVTVLVSPSNIWAMTKLYTDLPGLSAGAPRPKILPLYLAEEMLDISIMLKLMCVDPTSASTPLYMETVMLILREMAMEGKGAGKFSYQEFKARLQTTKWVPGQSTPLDMRLQLLEAFLRPSLLTRSTRPAPAEEDIWAFEPGAMTIVDLSDPFISSNDACSLFSICMSLFLEARGKSARVIALDEAHKFLTQSGAAQALTNDLTSVIRQQRHTGTRVFIATQEPTLSPEIIDLANVTFVHRFNSPAWYDVLRKHLAGAWAHESSNAEVSLFHKINSLEAGEALLFCSTAVLDVDQSKDGIIPQTLGCEYAKVKVRPRLTTDGGLSIRASETASGGPSTATANTMDIPMHVVTASRVAQGTFGPGSRRSAMTSTDPSNIARHARNSTFVASQNTLVIPSQESVSAALTTVQVPATTNIAPATVLNGSQNTPGNPGPTHNMELRSRTQGVASSRTVSQMTGQSQIERVVQQARLCCRARFQASSWSTWTQGRWDLLRSDVEAALSLPRGSIIADAKLKKQFRTAAKLEFQRCKSNKSSR